jgi:ankyrin repeat protein
MANSNLRNFCSHTGLIPSPDENGCTPLYWVSRGHQSDDFLLAKSFLEHGADVNAVTSFESCPLLEAFHWDRKKIGALLLEHGADASLLYRLLLYGVLPEENIEHANEWVEECRSKEFRDDDFYRVSV